MQHIEVVQVIVCGKPEEPELYSDPAEAGYAYNRHSEELGLDPEDPQSDECSVEWWHKEIGEVGDA